MKKILIMIPIASLLLGGCTIKGDMIINTISSNTSSSGTSKLDKQTEVNANTQDKDNK